MDDSETMDFNTGILFTNPANPNFLRIQEVGIKEDIVDLCHIVENVVKNQHLEFDGENLFIGPTAASDASKAALLGKAGLVDPITSPASSIHDTATGDSILLHCPPPVDAV